ncbi:MAG: hypothetical protein SOV73_01720 [Candidatus Faecivivens sp.]|nr:hypothetical protein [Oscillospiraceae bacterium]MDY2712038.1 hypothetical protein [Candidatus Faecivivens sp.]
MNGKENEAGKPARHGSDQKTGCLWTFLIGETLTLIGAVLMYLRASKKKFVNLV